MNDDALAVAYANAQREKADRQASTDKSLVAACDDPDLFGFDLWESQRQLLTSIDEGPRLHVMALGRRSSKTTMMALVGLWSCLLRPSLRTKLRPRERGYAVAVATNLRQAKLVIDSARSIIDDSPAFQHLVVSASESEIRFSNNTAFMALPCTARGGRGWPVFCLLLDEVAHFLDTEGNSAAEQIWQAFVPATLQFGSDARVIASSTPWGSTGLFADLYSRASSGEIPNAVAHHATTQEFNPTITQAELDAEMLVIGPDEFAAEYLADFVSAGASFLDADAIREAIVDRPAMTPDMATHWIAGLDPAFSRDPFGLALVGIDKVRKKLVLGYARRWLPGDHGDPGTFEGARRLQDDLLDQVADICREFNASVLTDQHLAPAVVDKLKRHGLTVRSETMTATSKTAAFSELRARLAAGQLELYGEPQLLDELRRLRSRFTAGMSQVVNPRVGDSHGDMAQALALATWGHKSWSPMARQVRIARTDMELVVGGLTSTS